MTGWYTTRSQSVLVCVSPGTALSHSHVYDLVNGSKTDFGWATLGWLPGTDRSEENDARTSMFTERPVGHWFPEGLRHATAARIAQRRENDNMCNWGKARGIRVEIGSIYQCALYVFAVNCCDRDRFARGSEAMTSTALGDCATKCASELDTAMTIILRCHKRKGKKKGKKKVHGDIGRRLKWRRPMSHQNGAPRSL